MYDISTGEAKFLDIQSLRIEFTSKRLRFTPLSLDDLDICIELFTSEAVTEYVADLMTEVAIRAQLPDWIRRGGDGSIGIWCVSDRESGEKYGTGALLPMPVERDNTDWLAIVPGKVPPGDIEIGYILKPSSWGRGIATEISERLVRFAFEDSSLQEVVATTDDDNVASQRVLEKTGFKLHGRRLAYNEDSLDFRIGKADWLAASESH